jgi:hypothetical protein
MENEKEESKRRKGRTLSDAARDDEKDIGETGMGRAADGED